MVKRLRKLARKQAPGAGSLLDSDLAQAVKDSAQQIWLAGLGAFGKAQEGGNKVFDTLVREGTNLQRKTQAAAEDRISEVAGRMTSMANDVSAKAGQRWDKLESIFEERVAKALNRLGVPARKDVDALIKRIDALSAKVGAPGKAKPRSAPRPAAKKAGTARRRAGTTAKRTARKAAA
jgi:poly(hydroxyalkanoate) granule-associated protein